MKISLTTRLFGLALLASSLLLADYKLAPAAAPPREASAVAGVLNATGVKVLKDDGTELMEAWFVKTLPGGGSAEPETALPEVPHGALIGVVKFPEKHADRRGQTIKPGVYTLRYSRYPVNGAHVGVAPQRDFAVLVLAEKDTDAAALPPFEKLMSQGRVAAGAPHPLVLSIWKEDQAVPDGVEAAGDEEKILHVTIGKVPFSMIIVGAAAH